MLYVDKSTRDEYPDVDVRSAFDSILHWFGGLNEVLFYPAELVRVISMLEAAKIEYEKSDFDFSEYRKLILGAGSEVMKIKEVD